MPDAMQTAKKLRPSFLEKFAIFSREQDHTQKAAGGGRPGQALDLVAFVEFQKHYRLALKVHKDCLLAVSGGAVKSCLLRNHTGLCSVAKGAQGAQRLPASSEWRRCEC